MLIALTFAAALVVGLVVTPIVREFAHRLELLDQPGGRKVHQVPIPRLGGVAMAIAFGFAIAGATIADPDLGSTLGLRPNRAPAILLGVGLLLAVGIVDDIRGMRALVKLTFQVGIACVAWWAGLSINQVHFPWAIVELGPLSLPVTVAWIVGVINAVNLIDGLDGLAAGVAIIGGTAFFFTAYWVHRNAVLLDYSDLATLLTAVLVGACLGFLPHNWFPSKIFMGDSGAMLIGLLMASAGVVSTGQITSGLYDRANGISTIIPILLPFAVLFLPLLDLGLAVVRRTARGRSPWSADRGHLHHKLLDIGYSHRTAVVLMYLWTAILSFGGLAFAVFPWQVVLVVDIVATLIMGLVTAWPYVARRGDDART